MAAGTCACSAVEGSRARGRARSRAPGLEGVAVKFLGPPGALGAPPSTVESSYLYPYMPQKRRAGSKARVMKTRMTTRTHMGRTSGQPGERKEH